MNGWYYRNLESGEAKTLDQSEIDAHWGYIYLLSIPNGKAYIGKHNHKKGQKPRAYLGSGWYLPWRSEKAMIEVDSIIPESERVSKNLVQKEILAFYDSVFAKDFLEYYYLDYAMNQNWALYNAVGTHGERKIERNLLAAHCENGWRTAHADSSGAYSKCITRTDFETRKEFIAESSIDDLLHCIMTHYSNNSQFWRLYDVKDHWAIVEANEDPVLDMVRLGLAEVKNDPKLIEPLYEYDYRETESRNWSYCACYHAGGREEAIAKKDFMRSYFIGENEWPCDLVSYPYYES